MRGYGREICKRNDLERELAHDPQPQNGDGQAEWNDGQAEGYVLS
jgi:hypothetical protein